jgi:hypothetical protein
MRVLQRRVGQGTRMREEEKEEEEEEEEELNGRVQANACKQRGVRKPLNQPLNQPLRRRRAAEKGGVLSRTKTRGGKQKKQKKMKSHVFGRICT